MEVKLQNTTGNIWRVTGWEGGEEWVKRGEIKKYKLAVAEQSRGSEVRQREHGP